MEVKAVGKNIRVQPRKVRIVADKVRGNPAARMASTLRFHKSKSAQALRKVIESAIANAENNYGLNGESLRISEVYVDGGPRLKRIQPRAMGRAYRIEKKTSHITVVVEETEAPLKTKNKGTQAKPRPTFGEKKKSKAKPVAEAPAPAPVEEPIAEEVVETEAVAEAPEVQEAPAEDVVETPAEEPAEEPAAADAEVEPAAEADGKKETE